METMEESLENAQVVKCDDGVTRRRTSSVSGGEQLGDGVTVEENISKCQKEGHHPLLNNVILSNMFEICHVRQLSNLRRVCKTWHSTSLPHFRSRATVYHVKEDPKSEAVPFATMIKVTNTSVPEPHSSDSESSQSSCWSGWSKNSEPPPSPSDLVAELDPKIATEYELEQCPPRHFSIDDIWLASIDQPFWCQCGAWMHSLTMTNCERFSGSVLQCLLLDKTPNLKSLTLEEIEFDNDESSTATTLSPSTGGKSLPNLKSLKIQCCRDTFDMQVSISILASLVQYFPNLQRMELTTTRKPQDLSVLMLEMENEYDYSNLYDRFDKLLQCMLEIRKVDPNKLRITHLDFMGLRANNFQQCSRSIAASFQELKLPLKTLSMDVREGTEDNVFESLLETHSSTLDNLSLRGGLYPNFPFGVSLDSLQQLDLIGQIVVDLKFLQYTPNLKSLYVRPWTDNLVTMTGKEHESDDGFVLPHLISFIFPIFQPGSRENVKVLAGWMPNLREIAMQMNKETFPEVCSAWKDTLQRMCPVVGDDIDDFVLTGLPPPILPNEDELEPWSSEEGLRRPNITDLSRLQSFDMTPRCTFVNTDKSQCNFRRQTLTELSFREGFMKIPSLKHLEFHMPQARERLVSSVCRLERKGVTCRAYSWHQCRKYIFDTSRDQEENYYF